MAWKSANLDRIVNAFIQAVDPKTLHEVMGDLPPRECHEVEKRIVDLCGKDALEAVEKAEEARRKLR